MLASVLSTVAIPAPVGAAVGNPVVTLGEVPGTTGNVVQTGTAIFDGLNECGGTTPAAPPVPFPGNDCGPGDNVVRTNDIVSYGYSIGVTNLDGPTDPAGPEFVDDVVFAQTISPSSPNAVVEFAALPPGCRTGTNPDTGSPYTPQSGIAADGSGNTTLTCNVGRLSGPSQTIFMQTMVRVDSDSKNNADFTSTDTICAEGCTPVSTRSDVTGTDAVDATTDNTAYISAAPRFDLAKNKYGPNDAGVVTNPATGELGFLYRFYPTIEVDAASDGKGSSPLDGDLTFSDMMYVQGTTTQVPLFEMHPASTDDCRWNNHGGRPVPYGRLSSYPAGTSVTDTGDVTCTQSAPGAPIEFTLSGTDTSGDQFPSKGSNDATSLQPPYYVASLYNYIWVPFEVVDRYDPAASCDAADTAAGFSAPFCGEVDTVGDLPVTNCLDDFDPNALDAAGNPVSNYGAGVEPGVYGANDGLNNCRNTSFMLRNRGGATKYFHSQVVDGGWVGGVPSGQTGYHTGDGPVEPGQTYATAARVYNFGTFPFANTAMCERIDNSSSTLIPIVSDASWVLRDGAGRKLPAEVAVAYQSVAQSDIIVEYASGPAGTPATGAVPWGNDHLAGGISPLSGLYDQSDAEGQRLGDCDDASGNWTSDPYSFDANEQASLQKIRAVRVRLADGILLEPGADIRLALALEMRNTFTGGPNDGELIPAGVIIPNFIDYKSDQLSSGAWRTTNYNQNTDINSLGDRLITSRGFVRIAKHIVPYNTPWGDVDPSSYQSTETGLSGDSFQFRLLPSVRSNLASGAADLTNVTVTDVLPAELDYDAVCTAGISAYPPPIVSNNTPAAGQTTLRWNLGTVSPNGDLDPIDFCVTSSPLAPDGTNAVNRTEISATEDSSTQAQRSASATVVLSQVGEFRVIKSVDSPLDPLDNNQIYTLEWLNSSDFVTLDANVVIDVFPHNDDEVGEGGLAPRNPGSDYTGTLELVGEPVSTEAGTFFYSKRAAVEVSYEPTNSTNPHSAAPYDASNPNLGPLADSNDDGEADSGRTIWCLEADFGTAGCPDDFAEATAMMFIGSSDIGPGERDSIAIELQANGNSPYDFYANRYATFTPSLPGQLNESNTVTVRTVGMVLGDLIWLDSNNNGIYEPARGEQTVPDGVVVELLDGSLAPTGETTTTSNGRYVFEGLESGQYAVRIPASQFAAGGPLDGLRAATAAGDPNDPSNEAIDQNGVDGPGGSVITGVIDLSYQTIIGTAGNIDIVGDEPLGDDVAALRVDIDDSLTNMTLDIGLIGDPAISIVTRVNGDDANTTPGVIVSPGDPVDWTYTVTNTGDIDLTAVTVTDSNGVTLSCANHLGDTNGDHIIDLLLPGQSVVCTASGTATPGQYTTVGDVVGDAGSGITVTDDDPANHFAAAAAIDIETDTNGEQADTGNGPLITSGGPVTWTYVVTNTGNVTLDDVTVTDDQLTAADISCANHAGDTNGDNVIDSLAPGQSVTCTATGTATSGQYANTGAVVGTPAVAGLADVTDTDPTHHWATEAAISIETDTNGVDADTGPGPMLPIGDTATWSYVVTNDGNLPLLDVTVGDSELTGADVSCANHLGDTNADNVIAVLLPGQSVTCTATGTVAPGQYANTGSVSGTPAFPTTDGSYDPADAGTWPTAAADFTATGDADVDDTDPTHHFGLGDDLFIEKSTNGADADTPSGPWTLDGGDITWTYLVINNANTALRDVAVTDDLVAAADISCADHLGDSNGDNVLDLLLPGDSVECSATGVATPGQYANVGDATGQPVYPTTPGPGFDADDPSTYPTDPAAYADVIDPSTGNATAPLNAQDPSHYFGTTASVDIEKFINGDDADVAPGPNLDNGSTATWTFTVTNTGTAPLTNVTVSDDDTDVTVVCPGGASVIALLLPGQSVDCTATGTVVAGSYVNIGSVEGQPSFPTAGLNGDPVDPTDPSTWSIDPADFDPIVTPGTTNPVAPVTDTDEAHHFGNGPAIQLVEEVCLLADQSACDTTIADHWGPERVHLPGDTEQWRYTVTNIGNVDLTNVIFTEPGLANCSTTIGDLAVGETRVITCSGQGTIPFATTSTVTGEGPTGQQVSDDSVATLLPPPELSIAKGIGDATLSRGELATYTITVRNVGAGTATGVVMTDPMPAGVTFVQVTSTGVDTSFESGTLRWNIGTMAPGASATLTFTARVTATAGSVTNIASVAANELEAPATMADNSDDAGFAVVAGVSTTATPVRPISNGTPSVLAFTGGNSGFMAGLALLLVQVGGAMMLLDRRRHRASA